MVINMRYMEERLGELLKQLSALRYQDIYEIPEWKMKRNSSKIKGIANQDTSLWETFLPTTVWGGHEEYYEFATTVTLPEAMEGKCVEFYLLTGREGAWDATNPQFTIYIDGILRQGLDINHQSVILSKNAKAGQTYDIYMTAFTGTQNFRMYLQTMLRTLDLEIEQYYYDLLIPLQVAALLGKEDSAYLQIMDKLNQSVNQLDFRKPCSKEFNQSLTKAKKYLEEEFYQKNSKETEATVCCVGHTHIDVAWLWTLAVTKDKAVRSFSTVVELMEQYPEYIFMSSQPQLYQYVKENAPEVYDKIKELVKEGRWEAEGGMFLEADCNLTSGESLVRQFLYGKRFFRKEFGVDNQILWLPDVFGYSAALPQIMEQSGIKYFMTTKISWNDTNLMPYDTFYWEGIDGTKILTHFITTKDYESKERGLKTNNEHLTSFTTNYNGYINPSQVKGAWQRYQQKNLSNEVLMSYGYGDGGGGPTKDMLETQRRLERKIPGCPTTKQSTARSFFDKLQEQIAGRQTPVWSGELYLEYHRATYTSMARNKRFNRISEFSLQNTELLGMLAKRLTDTEYPKELLANGWEVVMRNQFHDILPGSSIKEVYDDSKEEYEKLLAGLMVCQEELLQGITSRLASPVGSIILLNPNGYAYSGSALLGQEENLDPIWAEEALSRGTLQKTYQSDWLVNAKEVPPKGYMVWKEEQKAVSEHKVLVTETLLENDWYRIHLNEKGQFDSYYDKEAKRELLQT
ncbi:MAG: alpha-mannosidase, partial [Mobilitalea sp.]